MLWLPKIPKWVPELQSFEPFMNYTLFRALTLDRSIFSRLAGKMLAVNKEMPFIL